MSKVLSKFKRQSLRYVFAIIMTVSIFSLTACGGGGGSKNPGDTSGQTLTLSGSDTAKIGTSFSPNAFGLATDGVTGSDILTLTETSGSTTNKALQALGTADGKEMVISFLSTGEFEEISFLFRSASVLKGYSCDAADCPGTVVRDSSLKTATFNNFGITVSNAQFGPTNSATETLILNGTLSTTSSTSE